MADRFQIIDETLQYATAPEITNTDERFLVSGSKNVLIDRQRKVKTRNGYSRYGAANSALTPIRSAITWNTSTGTELPIRMYDDELEVYTSSAWRRILASWSTTETLRFAVWFDSTENLDQLLWVQGDDKLYKWGGLVAVVDSVTATTITKTGTDTWQQARAYTTGSKTLVNTRTGTEYTYTGGESTTTLTGIADTTGIVAGDILIQKVVTHDNEPADGRTNHTIFVYENQVCLGSEEDDEVYLSSNTDVTDYSFSSPRVAGEGALLTLDSPSRGFGDLNGDLICFAGRSSIFAMNYTEIAVSTTLAETPQVRKLKIGVDQGAFNADCIIPIGNSLAYLSNEPALRLIEQTGDFETQLRTLSNPIKPDFDAETWTNASGIWYKNAIYLCSPTNSLVYILEFIEDADGKLRRYWQPPQVLPVRVFSIISSALYGHSNVVAETYKLFDSTKFSDINSDDEKIPFEAVATFSYRNFGDRVNLKNLDEYYVEGLISPNTDDLDLTLNYDFGGFVQQLTKTIDGTDSDILEERLEATSLGQAPLGQEILGGSMSAPDNTSKFRVIFELAREDFREIQAQFSTNAEDRYWAIIARGPNAKMSARNNNLIKK